MAREREYRERVWGGKTGREGGWRGSILVPQSSDQNIMHLVFYGVTSPWSGIDVLLEHSLDNTYIAIYVQDVFKEHLTYIQYEWSRALVRT